MAPTRELCIQIYDVLALILRRYHWVVRAVALARDSEPKPRCCCAYVGSVQRHCHTILQKRLKSVRFVHPQQIAGTIYGGENRDKEKARLRKGVNVVVATPGCAGFLMSYQGHKGGSKITAAPDCARLRGCWRSRRDIPKIVAHEGVRNLLITYMLS
jgi:hypothetical protein